MAADDPERITKNNRGSYFFLIPPPLLQLCFCVLGNHGDELLKKAEQIGLWARYQRILSQWERFKTLFSQLTYSAAAHACWVVWAVTKKLFLHVLAVPQLFMMHIHCWQFYKKLHYLSDRHWGKNSDLWWRVCQNWHWAPARLAFYVWLHHQLACASADSICLQGQPVIFIHISVYRLI